MCLFVQLWLCIGSLILIAMIKFGFRIFQIVFHLVRLGCKWRVCKANDFGDVSILKSFENRGCTEEKGLILNFG